MGQNKTKTMNVDEETKRYIESMRKEILSSVQSRFLHFKFNVERKLAAIEEKLDVSTLSIPNKCEDFIRDRMSIVKELETSVQFYSEGAEHMKNNMTDVKASEARAKNRLSSIESGLKQAIRCIENQKSIIEKLKWSTCNIEENVASFVKTHENLKSKVSHINQDLYKFEDRLDDHDQYTRRNSLLMHGLNDVPQNISEKKFIEYACKKLNKLSPQNFEISPILIDTAHVLATKKKSRNHTKVVIVKFKLRWMRNKVIDDFENHFYQFHRGISITEHLCNQRKSLLKKSQKVLGKANVWTEQKVVFELFSGKRHPIGSEQHLSTLIKRNVIKNKQE